MMLCSPLKTSVEFPDIKAHLGGQQGPLASLQSLKTSMPLFPVRYSIFIMEHRHGTCWFPTLVTAAPNACTNKCPVQDVPELSMAELQERLDANEPGICLLDVSASTSEEG